MAQKIYLPEVDEFRSHLATLLGREISVAEGADPVASGGDVSTSYYVTREDGLAAIMIVERSLAIGMGGALAMIPAGAVEEMAKSGEDSDLLEAYGEVSNVLAGTLCRDAFAHVRLLSIDEAPEAIQAAADAIGDTTDGRLDCTVDLGDYGSGRLSLVTITQG